MVRRSLSLFQNQMSSTLKNSSSIKEVEIKKKIFSWNNILIGGAIQVFEVSTLGQPFEVIKTHMAGKIKIIILFYGLFCFFCCLQLIEEKGWFKQLNRHIHVEG